jgi:MATE family multidrug resistance protein
MKPNDDTRDPHPSPAPAVSPDGPLSVLRIRHLDEILRLATPTVLTMLSQTLMWTVDTALLGRVSSVALAAAGLGGMLTWTMYTLVNQLSRISQTFVSQAHGRGDDAKVGDFTWQGIYLAVAGGLLLQLLGFLSDHALPRTGCDPELLGPTYVYIRWRTLSAVFTQLTFCIMGFFQGRRDVLTPMVAGIVANVANLVLDIWLIYGWSGIALGGTRLLAVPALGIKGAAIATSLAQLVNAAILAWAMLRPAHRRRFRTHVPRPPSWRRIRDMIRVGAPSAWENFIDMSAFGAFSIFIGRLGAVQLAASQITIQLLAFSFMPMWGITIAGSVLTGNWIGAGQPDAAERYARQVYKLGLYYALGLAALLLAARQWTFRIFSDDPAVLALGAGLTTVAAVFQIADGMRMVSIGVLQGAGDTRYPMVQSLCVVWGLFVPLSYVIVVHRGGDVGDAWLGGTFCYVLQAVLLYLRFAGGRWKRLRIFSEE